MAFLDILNQMYTHHVDLALVLNKPNDDSPDNVKGLISKEDMTNYMGDTVELFTDV